MTRKAIRSGIHTGLLVAAALTVAAFASVKDDGVKLAAGGVEMTLNASLDKGLMISFIAPE
ncbi:MAG: hypothetical protein JJ931_14190 [Henriciella sp.]|nr:hypothetical protein [Henriciella sp.]MBO6696558.1 hypothetical protein [Henriciella sp.]